MGLSIRVSSTTSNGTANATSLGGYAAATGPSTSSGAFFHNTSAAESDAGHTDYRCVYVYNSGSTVMNNVIVTIANGGAGTTCTVAASSVATNTLAAYTTAVIAAETTAPAITGSYAYSVNIGTLNAGQVKAVWIKRVEAVKTAAASADRIDIVLSADEVIV